MNATIQKLILILFCGVLMTGCASTSGEGGTAPATTASVRKTRGELPPGTTLTIDVSAIYFSELVLNDGCTINFTNSLTNVDFACDRLILNADSKIDLTPAVLPPPQPSTPGPQGQAHADSSSPHSGANGTPGFTGQDGRSGINLKMVVNKLVGTNGSLWIKTDGTPGGHGGNGGDGGKGSSGPRTGVSNPDGGNGGTGGKGGRGGKGGNTAWVKLTIGHDSISPTQATGVAPSSRPQTIPGAIVISGAPGAGGTGGSGGGGGPEGEGHEGGSFPSTTTDSRSGQHGGNGPAGDSGPPGDFVAVAPPITR